MRNLWDQIVAVVGNPVVLPVAVIVFVFQMKMHGLFVTGAEAERLRAQLAVIRPTTAEPPRFPPPRTTPGMWACRYCRSANTTTSLQCRTCGGPRS